MKTIDITPTWKALVPAMLAVIENHEDTPSGWAAHGNIFAEFMRMADAADRWNEYAREAAALDAALDRDILRAEDGISIEDFDQ